MIGRCDLRLSPYPLLKVPRLNYNTELLNYDNKSPVLAVI